MVDTSHRAIATARGRLESSPFAGKQGALPRTSSCWASTCLGPYTTRNGAVHPQFIRWWLPSIALRPAANGLPLHRAHPGTGCHIQVTSWRRIHRDVFGSHCYLVSRTHHRARTALGSAALQRCAPAAEVFSAHRIAPTILIARHTMRILVACRHVPVAAHPRLPSVARPERRRQRPAHATDPGVSSQPKTASQTNAHRRRTVIPSWTAPFHISVSPRLITNNFFPFWFVFRCASHRKK